MLDLCDLEKIVHAFFTPETVLFEFGGYQRSPIDVSFRAPYNEKTQSFGRN